MFRVLIVSYAHSIKSETSSLEIILQQRDIFEEIWGTKKTLLIKLYLIQSTLSCY